MAVASVVGVADQRLAGGLALGVVGDVAPRAPELAEQRADAAVAGLVERRPRRCRARAARGLVAAERHVLAAVLDVEEAVAQAAVGLDLDALAEERARAVRRARRRSSDSGVGGDERGLLARVADGVRVGEVVGGDVEAALLGEQAAQRRLEAHEARDVHASRSRTRWAAATGARRAGGARAGGR